MAGNAIATAFVEVRADLGSLASDVQKGIGSALQSVGSSTNGAFKSIATGFREAVSGGWRNALSNVGTSFRNALSGGWRGVASNIGSGLRSAVGGAGRLLSSGFQAAAGVVGRGLSQAVTSAANVMRGAFTGAAAVIGAGLAQAIGGGISRSLALENSAKMLDNMGLNAKQSAQAMEALNQAVTGTAYSLDEGAGAMTRMISSGTGLDELPGMMTMIADTAAFGQAPLSEIGDIFSRIQGNGRAMGFELQQLATRNIPVYQLLADQFGVTEEEVRKMARAGEISADDFFGAWEAGSEGFGELGITIAGAAQGMGDTTTGAFANMRAALSRFGAEALRPLMELAKPAFDAIKAGVDAATAAIKPFVESVLGSSGFAKVKDFFVSLTPAVRDVADGVDYAAGVWRDATGAIIGYSDEEDSAFRSAKLQSFIDLFNKFKGVIAPLTAALGALGAGGLKPLLGPFSKLIPAINPVLAAFVTLVATTPELRTAFMDIVRAIMPVVQAIGSALQGALQQLLPSIIEVVEILGGVLQQVLPIIADLFLRIVDALAPLLPLIGELAVMFANAIAPILVVVVDVLAQLIGALVEGLAPVFPILVEALMALMPPFSELVLAVSELAMALLPLLVPLVQLLAELLAGVLSTALQVLVPVINAVVVALTAVVRWFTNIGDHIRGPLNAAFNLLKSAFGSVRTFIQTAINAIVGFFSALPGRIRSAFGDGYQWIRTKMTQAKDWVSQRVGDVVGFFTGLPGRIKTAFGDGFSWVQEKMSSAKDKVGELVDGVVTTITGLPQRLKDGFGSGWGFISNLFEAAVGAVKTAWNNTVGGFGFSLPGWIPGLGGKSFRIPTMASGGVVDAPTLALIGEYMGASNNPEIVTPQNIMRETMLEALGAFTGGSTAGPAPVVGDRGGYLIDMRYSTIEDATDAELVAQRVEAARRSRAA